MSISDPKVKVSEPAAPATALTMTAPALTSALPRSDPEVPYRTITDKELTLVQICCDFVCACIALPVSLVVLAQLSAVPVNAPRQLATNVQIDSLFPVAVVVALALGGVYRVTHRRLQPSAFLEIREICFGVGGGCVLALAVGSLFHVLFATSEPYATQLVMAVIVTTGAITLGRVILRYFLHTLTTTRVLVVGAGTAADRIMLSVRQDPGMTLVGRVVDDPADAVETDSLGRVADLPQLCRRLHVHRVLVAARDEFSVESMDVYRQLQDFVHIAMVPRYYELISWRSRLTDLAGMPFLELAQPHLSPWDRLMKRAFDLCISSAVLLITAPLLLIVAVGVKLSSPGPVFFRQIRIGRDTEPFMVTKFRSMTTGAQGTGVGVGVGVGLPARRPRSPAARGAPQVGRAHPHHALRCLLAPDGDRRDSAIHQRVQGRHVRRRAPAFRPERIQRRGLGDPPLRGAPGDHRPVAGLGPQRPDPQRPRPTRLSLRRVLVALVGPQDHVRDAQDDGPGHRRLLTRSV